MDPPRYHPVPDRKAAEKKNARSFAHPWTFLRSQKSQEDAVCPAGDDLEATSGSSVISFSGVNRYGWEKETAMGDGGGTLP